MRRLLVLTATVSLLTAAWPITQAGAAPVVASDFNGDGYADLAIGATGPGEAVGGFAGAGAVTIIYGSASGPATTIPARRFTAASPNVKGDPGKGFRFGATAVPGNFDGDAYADLAIGSPGEKIGSKTGAGAVHVLYGSATGLTAAGNQLLSFNSNNVPGGPGSGNQFGRAVATGDLNNDGFDDVVIGVPGRPVNTHTNAGAFIVMLGSANGLTGTGVKQTTQSSLSILGGSEAGDQFGSAVASGDFNGDGRSDIAVGAKGESIGAALQIGAVTMLKGAANTKGFSTTGKKSFTQQTVGMDGLQTNSARLGSSLASGNFDGDAYDDLLAGEPGWQGPKGYKLAGAMRAIYGGTTGLAIAGNQFWTQNSDGVPGVVEPKNSFGFEIASGDTNNDGFADLAVSAPIDEVRGYKKAGNVITMFGSASGIVSTGSKMWLQDLSGMPDDIGANHQFGSGLTMLDTDGDGFFDLAIGAITEPVAGKAGAGAVNLLFGTLNGIRVGQSQKWTEETPGIPGATSGGDNFGQLDG